MGRDELQFCTFMYSVKLVSRYFAYALPGSMKKRSMIDYDGMSPYDTCLQKESFYDDTA